MALFLGYSILVFVALHKLNAPWHAVRSDLAVFVGVAYRQHEDWILKHTRACWVRIAIFIISFAIVIVHSHLGNNPPTMLNLLPYVWIIFMFVAFAYVKVCRNKPLAFLTKISYDIYLCQGIAFDIVPYKEWNFILSFLAICLLTVVIATFCHWAHGLVFKR